MKLENDTLAEPTTFDWFRFRQVLIEIEAMAAETENDPNGPVKEFELLHNCGALELVLPDHALDFSRPNTPALLQLLKDIGKANLSVGRIFEGHINTLYLIHLYATPHQRHKWYNGVIENGDIFGIWNTQNQNGIQYTETSSQLEIAGSKTFCSGAMLVNKALITGNIKTVERDGWQMAIIDMDRISKDQIDKESWKPLGMKASGSYTVDFSGYQLDDSELLGEPGIYLKQPYFNGGAIRFAAVQLGGAEAIAEHTANYLKELNRTDDPFQQLRLSCIMSAVMSGRLWLEQAGKYFDSWVNEGNHDEDLIAFANMTRVNIEEICLTVMDNSNRCVGARGLMETGNLGRIFRDLTFYLRQPAPDATRLNVAKFFINNPSAFHE
ncbi:acyl-CoA/acyl-ACP dehydrogenase [Pedobacter sp. MC2016-05]|uniref:acyl-CoA dehydrogenase family protein n=1 Tax=Pedobacter sp. MC2016-05 TaxID=2994474 RepID=UPI002247E387|nr:acyl-CoA dehydrogenase family protein [Pedobacter sp. MC2016-05]MCX2476250.1 acyl-CoA/acyl-ACP dehydrogenase [Pedobacter sp. MC2016-05]